MRRQIGFTLIEVLVALAVLAILLYAFVRFFSGTLQASGELSVRNELLAEGQNAHHLIASRIKEAWYVFPPGTSITLGSGWTTKNTLGASETPTWTTGKFFLAMILPPLADDVNCSAKRWGCFRFYAYYPLRRDWYVKKASVIRALDPDPVNDGKVWVVVEYLRYYREKTSSGYVSRCPVTASGTPDPTNTYYRSGQGRFLVDYVQPTTDPWDSAYNYNELFSYQTSSGQVTAVTTKIRYAKRAAGSTFRVPSEKTPLTLTVVPQNLGVKARTDRYYCK